MNVKKRKSLAMENFLASNKIEGMNQMLLQAKERLDTMLKVKQKKQKLQNV
jgi:hypothetical protein